MALTDDSVSKFANHCSFKIVKLVNHAKEQAKRPSRKYYQKGGQKRLMGVVCAQNILHTWRKRSQ